MTDSGKILSHCVNQLLNLKPLAVLSPHVVWIRWWKKYLLFPGLNSWAHSIRLTLIPSILLLCCQSHFQTELYHLKLIHRFQFWKNTEFIQLPLVCWLACSMESLRAFISCRIPDCWHFSDMRGMAISQMENSRSEHERSHHCPKTCQKNNLIYFRGMSLVTE